MRWLVGLAVVLGLSLPVFSAPIVEPGSDILPANMTSVTGNLSGTAATVTPTVPSRHWIIKTDPAAAVAYVAFSGTATSSNFRIDPGCSLNIDGPPLPSISIIGASATGTYSVAAW